MIKLLSMSVFALLPIANVWAMDVNDGWAKPSLTKQANNGAAYLTLTNPTNQNDRLLKASSEVADVVEIHEMTFDEGVMKMAEIDGLDIPTGETVKLEPGGYHIMLMGLNDPLTAGKTFDVQLKFENAGTKSVSVDVRKPKEMHHNGHKHHK